MVSDYETLLREAKKGSQPALAAIYDAFHQPLYRYIYRQVDGPETARDLTADLFRRFLQALQNGTGPEQQLSAWLYRVAHNIIIDHYRRQQHRDHVPLYEEVVSADDDPVHLAEAHIATDQLYRALQQLTPDQQQIIALKFFAGLSNQEIAAIVAKPVGAVKALQHRAIAALRRQLQPLEKELTV